MSLCSALAVRERGGAAIGRNVTCKSDKIMANKKAIEDTIFVGDGPEVMGLFDRLKHPERVLGCFCDAEEKEGGGFVRLGSVADAAKYINSNLAVCRVYCGMSCIDSDVVRGIQAACKVRAVKFCAVLPVVNDLDGTFVPMHIGKSLLLTPQAEPLSRLGNLAVKRCLDFLLSALILLTIFPVVYLCKYISIKKLHLGTALRVQTCAGPNGKPFRRLTFRVAEGKMSSGWDELPQLMNVLLGQMSLVGPSPVAVTLDKKADAPDALFSRSYLKAGMTGLARVKGSGRSEGQLAHDLWYIEKWSIWMDVSILVSSIFS